MELETCSQSEPESSVGPFLQEVIVVDSRHIRLKMGLWEWPQIAALRPKKIAQSPSWLQGKSGIFGVLTRRWRSNDPHFTHFQSPFEAYFFCYHNLPKTPVIDNFVFFLHPVRHQFFADKDEQIDGIILAKSAT